MTLRRAIWVVAVFALALAVQAAPAFSAHNGRIVVELGLGAEATQDPSRLVSMLPDGSHVKRLGRGLFPSFTSSGRFLVYNRYGSDCRGHHLCPVVTRPNGHLVRRLRIARSTSYPLAPYWPALSPDGHRLLYERAAPNAGGVAICVSRADGTHERTLATFGNGGYPSWSPDGHSIAVTADSKLVLLDPESGSQRVLFPAAAPDVRLFASGRPSWSPDGTQIAFGGDDYEHGPGVYTISSSGGEADWRFPGIEPVWSPSGKLIATLYTPPPPESPAVRWVRRTSIVIRRLSGAVVRKIDLGSATGEPFTWQPVG